MRITHPLNEDSSHRMDAEARHLRAARRDDCAVRPEPHTACACLIVRQYDLFQKLGHVFVMPLGGDMMMFPCANAMKTCFEFSSSKREITARRVGTSSPGKAEGYPLFIRHHRASGTLYVLIKTSGSMPR